jgi:hypothetical protein
MPIVRCADCGRPLAEILTKQVKPGVLICGECLADPLPEAPGGLPYNDLKSLQNDADERWKV